MSYQDHDLTGVFCQFLIDWEDSRDFEPFDVWLMANYPHTRMQEIGDAPTMFWFSVSRCNPPKNETDTLADIMVLNWSMMTAWRIVYDDTQLSELDS